MNNKGLKKLLTDKNPEVPKIVVGTKPKRDIPIHYVHYEHYENSSPASRTITRGNTVWTITDY